MTEPTTGRPRLARVYDGRDATGRPLVGDRPPVDPELRESLLTYLESAPVILAARSLDPDEFSPGEIDVPLNYRTDGTWIWAGSVPHYLRKHGLCPDPGLVWHILDRDFRLDKVEEAAKKLAVETITGQ